VIKTDIMGVFQDFHAHSKFVKSLNDTFIALILKKSRALDLKGCGEDYLEISECFCERKANP
jgi:hypothetical protein